MLSVLEYRLFPTGEEGGRDFDERHRIVSDVGLAGQSHLSV
jgi:hypothetical protein